MVVSGSSDDVVDGKRTSLNLDGNWYARYPSKDICYGYSEVLLEFKVGDVGLVAQRVKDFELCLQVLLRLSLSERTSDGWFVSEVVDLDLSLPQNQYAPASRAEERCFGLLGCTCQHPCGIGLA